MRLVLSAWRRSKAGESKLFFFEKRTKKNFCSLECMLQNLRDSRTKIFFASFSKKQAFLLLTRPILLKPKCMPADIRLDYDAARPTATRRT